MDRWLQRSEDSLAATLGVPPELIDKLVASVLVCLVALAVRWIVVVMVTKKLDDPSRRYIAIKTVNYIVGIGLFFVLLRIWLGGLSGLAASIGIISAGLAIALHEPLSNLVGWFFITIRRPFVIGDRIQVGDRTGDVIDLRLFAFSLVEIGNWVDAEQSTGRILHIPNGRIFKDALANYTQGFNFIWSEIPVTVTFESDWRKAKTILGEIAERNAALTSEEAARQIARAASKYLIRYDNLTPVVWTSVADIGVTLTMRFITEPRRRRSAEEVIWEEILDRFAACDDIDFAYPTQRFYDNVTEGKPGARADRPGRNPGDR